MKSNSQTRSFLIVRHPFHRLVSTYRDKFERGWTVEVTNNYFYKTYGKHMVTMFRKRAVERFGREFFERGNQFGAPVKVEKGYKTKVGYG